MLYTVGAVPEELLGNWEKVLKALSKCDLRLSASKTVVTPLITTILGWVWNQGTLAASPHRIAPLSSCSVPETMRGLQSFIGAYKVLGRVLPHCSQIISDLDNATSGKQSLERIVWTDELLQCFRNAQKSLSDRKTITLPCPSDQIWINY